MQVHQEPQAAPAMAIVAKSLHVKKMQINAPLIQKNMHRTQGYFHSSEYIASDERGLGSA